MKRSKWLIVIFGLLLVLGIIGCSSESSQTGENTTEEKQSAEAKSNSEENDEIKSVSGGQLRVAMSAQPPTLDPHTTTAISSSYVTEQFYEGLVTVNSNYEAVPHLAESVEISDDGKTYTFFLRQGIKFHNGKEMTAEDVAASMNRWKDISPSGVPEIIQEGHFKVVDDYTVSLEINAPSPLLLASMGTNRFAAIMPKEVIEEADESGVKEFIGTGPFKLAEWKQDQYVYLTKYEDYQVVDLPADGTAGRREALVDDVYFIAVPDAATQVAGIQTGEYDMVLDLPNAYYEQVSNNPDLHVDVTMYGTMTLLLNKNEGIFSDVKMRQAVNAAVDFDQILLASFISEDLYRANSSYMLQEQTLWYTEAGSDSYNQKDVEKAKKLLEEAGYNGETVTIITSRDYEHLYNAAVVTKEQLDNIGMNVELEVYDWPTVSTRSADPSTWGIFPNGFAGRSAPTEIPYFNNNYVDGPKDDKTNELLSSIASAETEEEAEKLWNELQKYSWEFLPTIKIGDFPKITVMRTGVEGYQYFNAQPVLWNTSNAE